MGSICGPIQTLGAGGGAQRLHDYGSCVGASCENKSRTSTDSQGGARYSDVSPAAAKSLRT